MIFFSYFYSELISRFLILIPNIVLFNFIVIPITIGTPIDTSEQQQNLSFDKNLETFDIGYCLV